MNCCEAWGALLAARPLDAHTANSVREAITQSHFDLSQLAPKLGGTCNGYLTNYRSCLRESIAGGASGVAIARQHGRVLDGLLGALYCAADAASRARGHEPRGRVALVAVGGYGRGIVGLHSDVDVLFLCDHPDNPHVRSLAEGVLYPLWDLGVEIGHVVRGVDETIELSRNDIRTATTLIDLRRVAGDGEICDELFHRARRHVFGPSLDEFIGALERDTDARHSRFGGSLYLLEPEVKLGRGGLRDMDVAEWAARARWGARDVHDYVRFGALLSREVNELEEAREMLWRVRNLLHLRAGRKHDRLTFADQEEIASQMGFVDGLDLAVEQLMQSYYRHARIVAQTAERMLARTQHRDQRPRVTTHSFGDGTMIFGDQMTLEDSKRLKTEPELAFRLYRQVIKNNLPPYTYARDAIARIAVDPSFRSALQASAEARDLFIQLLTSVAPSPIRRETLVGELHNVGLLIAMIPEFEPLTGRVHHDVYHVYTVDVHSIAAVNQLHRLIRGEQSRGLYLAARLAAEAPRPVPLTLAILLHALGKPYGRDYQRKGAGRAKDIVRRLGLSEFDVDHVAWLIERQSELYHWATRRDTSDPDTVAEIARRVGTVERLRDLYLATVAILSTTNPRAMTSWKARMLEDLYFVLVAALKEARQANQPAVDALPRTDVIRNAVRVGFNGDAGREELEAFLVQMPDRYVLAHPVDEIRRHARIARDRNDARTRVILSRGAAGGLAELIVVTDDRPGLLAEIAVVLDRHGLEVSSAEIHTRPRGECDEAFDVFFVEWPDRRGQQRVFDSEDGEVSLAQQIERDLDALRDGSITAEAMFDRRPSTPPWAVRKGPDVVTRVVVDNQASPDHTIVDVYTKDRAGLLHTIANTLYSEGLSISLSKLNTEGDQVVDIFYVQDAEGGKLRDPERLLALQDKLRERVDRFHQQSEQKTTGA